MALEDIDGWVFRAQAAIRRIIEGFEERVGYEPYVQEIRRTSREPDPGLSDLPGQVRAFFGKIDEVSWPDVWNGYFLGPAGETIRGFREEDPGWVEMGTQRHRCVAIGNDGSGAYFVCDLDAGGAVLRVSEAFIDEGGLLRGGFMDELAPDLDAFLDRLLDNVVAVANGQTPDF